MSILRLEIETVCADARHKYKEASKSGGTQLASSSEQDTQFASEHLGIQEQK